MEAKYLVLTLLVATFASTALAQTYYFASDEYEVEEDTGVLTVCINREGSVSEDIQIEVTVTSGTTNGAVEGTDFSSFGTFNFLSGNTQACDQVTITNDGTDEGDETFTLSIASSVTTRTPFVTEVTITDDDDAVDYYWEDDSYETSEDSVSVQVCMRRSGTTGSRNIQVQYSSSGSNGATINVDYNPVSVWTFSDGDSRECESIGIRDDNNAEGTESFQITILTTGNSDINIISPSTTVIEIDDEDDDIEYYFAQSSYAVAENVGSVSVCMSRSATTSTSRTIQVSYQGISAVNGADFTPGSSSFIFSSSQRTTCNTISITDDDDDEDTETFTITILSTSGVNIGSPSVTTVSITDDDDDDVEIRFSSPSYSFLESSGTVFVSVTKTGTSRSATATLTTYSGTADAGVDFSVSTTFISIPASTGTITVPISIIEDPEDEPDETFTLVLSGANSGVTITQSSTVVSIRDNDPTEESDERDLTDGEIAGIVIGVVGLIILIIIIIVVICCCLAPGGANNPCQPCLEMFGFSPPKPALPVQNPGLVYNGYNYVL